MLNPPNAVRRIAERLTKAGFETWCVGGAVRDALLGRANTDWDLATAATPMQMQTLFEHTVPLGIEFGTVGVLDEGMHEVTTFRRDINPDGRHAGVEFGASLDEDLARRDFTMNAIAYSPITGELHDPFGGREDLALGVIRAVGDPSVRMAEDRLRALRALRFAGRFEFAIDGPTWNAIVESAPFLLRLSRERIKQELDKTMEQVREPSRSLHLWQVAGIFAAAIPELNDTDVTAADKIAMPDATKREDLAAARARNRLTTLFLDLAPDVARRTLRALRSSNQEIDAIVHQVTQWHALGPAVRGAMQGDEVSDLVIRRWVLEIGRDRFKDFLRIVAARTRRNAAFYKRAVTIAFRDPVSQRDLAINGSDLIAAGLTGPAIGAALRRLLEVVIEDPSQNQRERLLELAHA